MVAIVGGAELGLNTSSGRVLGDSGQLGSASQGRAGEGVSVNAITGNLVLQRQDELLIGRGYDVGVVRTYNSLGLLNDDNGDNWRLGFSRKVYGLTGTANTAGSTIKRIDEDGAEVIYTYDATRSAYVATKGDGAYDLLTYNTSTQQWTWIDGTSRSQEKYDGANGGRLTQIVDLDGNTVTLAYNAASLVTSVTDANGEQVLIDYDTTTGKTSNITQIRTLYKDANNQTQTLTRVRYGYDDPSNRLISVSVDLSPNDNSTADNKTYVTNYTYDSASKRVASIQQSDGSWLKFAYDASQRIQTIQDYRSASDIRTTTFSYDTSNQKTTITDTINGTTILSYDVNSQITSIQNPTVAGVSQITQFGYDVNGNVTSVTDPRGNFVTYNYDNNGNRVLERDAAGNTVTRVYDTNNRLLSETTYTVADPDGAGTAQPSGAQTTYYVYDANLHQRFRISPDGRVSEYRYNAQGQMTSQIAYTGAFDVLTAQPTLSAMTTWIAAQTLSLTQRSDTTYGLRGQVAQVTTYAAVDSSGNGINDGTQSVTQYVYDQAGLLLQTIDARGVATTSIANDYITSYTYDGLGRLLTATNALGAATATVYDDANRKTTVTLANGLTTATTFDQAGLAVAVVQSDISGVLGTTQYTYDKFERLVAKTDPLGNKTYRLYDADSRLVGEIDALGSLVEYIYNQDNQVIKQIAYNTRLNISSLAAADPATLTLSTWRPAASSGLDRTTYRLYDASDRLVKTIDGLGAVTEFRYDGANQLVTSIQYATKLSAAQLTALAAISGEIASSNSNATVALDANNDRQTRYFYSADGLLLGTLDGDGYLTEYRYNAAGQRIEIAAYATVTNSANWATGTLSALRPAADSVNDQHTYFIYNAEAQLVGQVVSAVGTNSYLTEYQYDLVGNKTAEISYANALVNYAYDATKTIAQLRPATSSEDQRVNYTYDALNQLVRVDSLPDGATTTYTYNSVGNLTQTTKALNAPEQQIQQRRYDSLGRVVTELSGEGVAAVLALGGAATQAQIDAVWAQFATSYTYDANGNRISMIDANANRTLYYYDATGALSYVVNALGEVQTFVYSSFSKGGSEITTRRKLATRVSATTLTTWTGGSATTISGAIAALTSTSDSIDVLTYDQDGQLVSVTNGWNSTGTNQSIINYTRNAFGEVTQAAQLKQGSTYVNETFALNRRGLQISDTRDSGGANLVTATQYDAFGRATQITDARGKQWLTSYDRLGRVVSTTDPTAAVKQTTYDAFDRVLTRTDALGNVTTYSYNSANRSVTVTSPENIQVTTVKNRLGQVVSVVDGRGNTTSYAYDKDGNLKTVTDAAGTVSNNYDRADRLIETFDANNVKTAYTYDAANRILTRSVDPSGLNLTTTTTYDTLGRAIWQKDANGIWTQTQYDLKGQVTSVSIDPLQVPNASGTLVANVSGLNIVTTYAYDARGATLTVTQGSGSSQPRTVQYDYDNAGRRIAEHVDPAGLNLTTVYTYDANNNLIAKTDPIGAITRYVYSARNELVYTVDATGAVVGTDYDAEGRVTTTTAYADKIDISSLSLTISSNPAATINAMLLAVNSAFQTNVANQITRTVYDRDDRAIFSIDGRNYVTEKWYDNKGNVIQTIRYAKALTLPSVLDVSHVRSAIVTDTKDQSERTVYDAADRAIFTIDAANYATQIFYDNNGRVIKKIQYANQMAGTLTDNVAPQILTTAGGTAAYIVKNAAADRTTRTIYDNAGRARFSVDAEGYITEQSYDAVGREQKSIRYSSVYSIADGATVASVAGLLPAVPAANDAVVQNIYDNAGRLSKTIDAENNVTLHVYNAAGFETDTTEAYGTADASITHRVYDNAGRLTEEDRGYNPANGTSLSATRYALDGVGNRLKIIEARGIELAETDSDWAKATRPMLSPAYPALVANLSPTQKDALRALYTTTQTFDALGNLISSTDPLGGKISTQYDAFGNAVKVTDPRGKIGYFYFDQNNNCVMQVDPEGYVTKTVFNGFGTTDSITHYAVRSTGATVATPPTPQTDANDQLTVIEHDNRNLQTKITNAEGQYETMSYDAFGNKTSYRNQVGGVFTYTYDRNGNVLTEVAAAAFSIPQSTKIYQYDARGNIKQLTEAAGTADQRITYYQYDRLNRQIAKTGEVFSAFDATTQTDYSATPSETRKYDGRGNLIEVAVTQGNGVVSRTLSYYDALNRNIAQITPVGQLTLWTYNSGNKAVAELAYSTAVALPTVAGGVPPAANISGTFPVRETRYTYDADNRLTSTLTPNVLIGEQDSTSSTPKYKIFTSDLVASNVYDAAGNLVKTTDARGNMATTPYSTYMYYDNLGRKILQIDNSNYVTKWQYDANGNVTQQYQYAIAYTGTATTGSDTTTLINGLTTSADDRITNFTYDRLGRLKQKQIMNVANATINATNGQYTAAVGAATTSYVYTTVAGLGIGQSIQETDATGAVTTTYYDTYGNKIKEVRPAYTDSNNVSVTPTTDFEYNALGLVKREIDRGTDNSVETDDRITSYSYTTGGRLASETDPTGAVTQYRYDAASNTTKKTLVGRKNADGITTDDVTQYRYDLANREVWRKDVSTQEVRETRYDVFGEITGKRLNGGGVGAAWQEVTDYNAQGQIWRSNQQDGAAAVQIYDANGNATLRIESAGTDFSQKDNLTDILNLPDAQKYITISQYDKRNQLTDTAQPQLNPTQGQVDIGQYITQTVGANYSANLTVGSTLQTPPTSTPTSAGAAGASGGSISESGTIYHYNGAYGIYAAVSNFTVTIPDMGAMGGGNYYIQVMPYLNGVANTQYAPGFDVVPAAWGAPTTFTTSTVSIVGNCDTLVVGVYKRLPSNALVQIGQFTHSVGAIAVGGSANVGGSVSSQYVYLSGQPTGTTKVLMAYRPVSSGTNPVGGWSFAGVPASGGDANAFMLNWGGIFAAGTTYDLRYYAFDAYNNIINAEAGSITISGSGAPSIVQSALPLGGLGNALMDTGGSLHFLQQGSNATQMRIRYRVANSGAAWSSPQMLTPNIFVGNGWFTYNPASNGLSGTYEYMIEALDGYGSVIKSAVSTFSTYNAGSVYEDLSGIQTISGSRGQGNIGNTSGTGNFTVSTSNTIVLGAYGFDSTANFNVAVQLPGGSNYPTRAQVTLTSSTSGVSPLVFSQTFAAFQGGTVTSPQAKLAYYSYGSVRVQLFRQTPQGEVQIGDQTYTPPTNGSILNTTTNIGVQLATLNVFNQPAGTSRVVMISRLQNTDDPWMTTELSWNGSAFALDWSLWAQGNYDFRYVALDGSGNVLNSETGVFGGTQTGVIFGLLLPQAYSIGEPSTADGTALNIPKSAFVTAYGVLNITEQGIKTQQLVVHYRALNSGSAWTTTTASQGTTTGWFTWAPSGLSANTTYEYWIEGKDSAGNVLNRERGTFVANNSSSIDPNSVSNLAGYSTAPEIVQFKNQPTNAASMTVTLTGNGNTYNLTLYPTVAKDPSAGNVFSWDGSALTPASNTGVFAFDAASYMIDRFTQTTYSFSYATKDASGNILTVGGGTLNLGANAGATISSRLATSVPFDVPQSNATKLVLYYRPQGSSASTPYTQVPAITRANAATPFYWNASQTVPVASGVLAVDYYYDLYDANGTLIINGDGTNARVFGSLTIGDTTSSSTLLWTITSSTPNPAAIIHRYQSYDAFGEIKQEIDGRGNVTDLSYNTMGLLVKKQDPTTDVTSAYGTVSRARPTTTFYYDLEGRLVGIVDPKGNVNTETILAGTGRNGSEAQIVSEFHADYGIRSTAYDVFGDAKKLTDEIGQVTLQDFDKDSHLIKVTRPQRSDGTQLIETYEYDQAGNRIAHTNTLNKREKTYYDSLGRVTQTTSFAGLSTLYTYQYLNSILGNSSVQVGGYQQTTVMADGHSSIDNIDYFGRTTTHWDLGGHRYDYTYNAAGWLVGQTNGVGQNIVYDYYANGYLKDINDIANNAFSYYEYDADGNRSVETYKVGGQYYQNAVVTYDELNRVKEVNDPLADIRYQYDANGNRMRVLSFYHDAVYGHPVTQDYWYTYDSMNRFLISMGRLNGSTIDEGAAGGQGVRVAYNAASQRVSAHYAIDNRTETYTYTSDGYLADRLINGTRRSSRVNDAAGRTTAYYEYDTNGTTVTFTRETGYNDDNQMLWQNEWNGVKSGTAASATTYDYYDAANTNNNAGPLKSTTNVSSGTTVTTITEYEWWDEAKQSMITIQGSNPNVRGNWAKGYSHFSYDSNGHIRQVDDPDSVNPRSMSYVVDAQGLILSRDEKVGGMVNSTTGVVAGGTLSLRQTYYYLDGHRIGDIRNDGKTDNVSYAEELAQEHSTKSRKDQYKHFRPISSADFDQNYVPIDSDYPGGASTSYTVRSGDTLQTIAASLWGDSAMWYLLADANGLNGSETLKAGQVLTVPNKVTNIHNNSSTFKVYDAGEALGDTAPTLPAPPPPPHKHGHHGCGGIATILIVVVAVIVTIYTAGAASGLIGAATAAGGTATTMGTMAAGMAALGGSMGGLGLAAAAIGGAVGSMVSQGLAMSMGIQDKFSWGQVATSAIGAGVGASSLGASVSGSLGVTSQFGQAMVSGAVGSAVSQGIGVATGLQEKFSWTQVAASAVGAGVGQQVGKGIGTLLQNSNWGETATKFAQGFGSSLASGGAYALTTGQKPNWGLIAANSFGSALGNATADSIVKTDQDRTINKVLDGLGANREADRVTAKFVQNMVEDGATADQVLGLLNDHPTLGSDLRNLDQASFGRSDDELGEVTKNYLKTSSAQTGSTAAVGPDDVVVTAHSDLPDGQTILSKTLSSGIELADSLIDLSDKYGVAGQIAYKAVTGLISGGPVKSVVMSVAKYAASQAANQVINLAGDAAANVVGGFVSDWARTNNVALPVSLGGVDFTLGADEFGYAAGQLAATVTESALGKGLDSAVLRAQDVRKITLSKNAEEGRLREAYVQQKLEGKFKDASVQREQYLRDANGKIAKDPITGEARRIDHVVIKDGEVSYMVETTSKTANKSAQVAKEVRIKSNGGTYIRDRNTGELIDVSGVTTRTSRRK